jgi:hypothetical protein
MYSYIYRKINRYEERQSATFSAYGYKKNQSIHWWITIKEKEKVWNREKKKEEKQTESIPNRGSTPFLWSTIISSLNLTLRLVNLSDHHRLVPWAKKKRKYTSDFWSLFFLLQIVFDIDRHWHVEFNLTLTY